MRQKTIIFRYFFPFKQVNSRVVGADVYENNVKRTVSNISVEITFEHIFSGLEYSLSSVECVFWDSVDRSFILFYQMHQGHAVHTFTFGRRNANVSLSSSSLSRAVNLHISGCSHSPLPQLSLCYLISLSDLLSSALSRVLLKLVLHIQGVEQLRVCDSGDWRAQDQVPVRASHKLCCAHGHQLRVQVKLSV